MTYFQERFCHEQKTINQYTLRWVELLGTVKKFMFDGCS